MRGATFDHRSAWRILGPALAGLCASGCFLDSSALAPLSCANSSDCAAGETCVDGRCERRPQADGGDAGTMDAGPGDAGGTDGGIDAGIDAGPPDAGPPHCIDGVIGGGETDVDCGGPECPPCDACLRCTTGADCASGNCDAVSRECEPVLGTVTEGSTFNAFVRADGRVLIAHYAPGAYNLAYDPALPQLLTTSGGAAATPSFAPDPCRASGHMSFERFDPTGRTITIECGADYSAPTARYRADDLFTSFGGGTYGSTTSAASGDHPGWAAIAPVSAGLGRGGAGMCGSSTALRTGGIGYCDGSPAGWANHLVSLTIDPTNVANSFAACAGRECRLGPTGLTCPHIWIWIDP